MPPRITTQYTHFVSLTQEHGDWVRKLRFPRPRMPGCHQDCRRAEIYSRNTGGRWGTWTEWTDLPRRVFLLDVPARREAVAGRASRLSGTAPSRAPNPRAPWAACHGARSWWRARSNERLIYPPSAVPPSRPPKQPPNVQTLPAGHTPQPSVCDPDPHEGTTPASTITARTKSQRIPTTLLVSIRVARPGPKYTRLLQAK